MVSRAEFFHESRGSFQLPVLKEASPRRVSRGCPPMPVLRVLYPSGALPAFSRIQYLGRMEIGPYRGFDSLAFRGGNTANDIFSSFPATLPIISKLTELGVPPDLR